MRELVVCACLLIFDQWLECCFPPASQLLVKPLSNLYPLPDLPLSPLCSCPCRSCTTTLPSSRHTLLQGAKQIAVPTCSPPAPPRLTSSAPSCGQQSPPPRQTATQLLQPPPQPALDRSRARAAHLSLLPRSMSLLCSTSSCSRMHPCSSSASAQPPSLQHPNRTALQASRQPT